MEETHIVTLAIRCDGSVRNWSWPKLLRVEYATLLDYYLVDAMPSDLILLNPPDVLNQQQFLARFPQAQA